MPDKTSFELEIFRATSNKSVVYNIFKLISNSKIQTLKSYLYQDNLYLINTDLFTRKQDYYTKSFKKELLQNIKEVLIGKNNRLIEKHHRYKGFYCDLYKKTYT